MVHLWQEAFTSSAFWASRSGQVIRPQIADLVSDFAGHKSGQVGHVRRKRTRGDGGSRLTFPVVITMSRANDKVAAAQSAHNRAVGKRIKQARLDADMPRQHNLASATGISRSHISEFESGVKTCSWATLVRIADATGVDSEWLATGNKTEAA